MKDKLNKQKWMVLENIVIVLATVILILNVGWWGLILLVFMNMHRNQES